MEISKNTFNRSVGDHVKAYLNMLSPHSTILKFTEKADIFKKSLQAPLHEYAQALLGATSQNVAVWGNHSLLDAI